MNIEVFHGTDVQAARQFQQGMDFYCAQRPNLPTAVFSNDIRFAVVFAGGLGRGTAAISTWRIPEEMLSLVDSDDQERSKWYCPTEQVTDLSTLPMTFLRNTEYKTLEIAQLAVTHGKIMFVRVPHEHFRGYELASTIMMRFMAQNNLGKE